jgi:putative PIN family toxin of toxin-antitoxin system
MKASCAASPTAIASALPLPDPAPMRVVLDTNVLVSLYVFADSRFAPLRQKIESGEWIALTREDCLAEFRRVLGYPVFALDAARQDAAFAEYLTRACRDETKPSYAVALPRCSDRDDQKFLELARDGKAEWLVTADKALLRLARRDRLQGMFRILPPETALLLSQPAYLLAEMTMENGPLPNC